MLLPFTYCTITSFKSIDRSLKYYRLFVEVKGCHYR